LQTIENFTRDKRCNTCCAVKGLGRSNRLFCVSFQPSLPISVPIRKTSILCFTSCQAYLVTKGTARILNQLRTSSSSLPQHQSRDGRDKQHQLVSDKQRVTRTKQTTCNFHETNNV